MPFHIDNRSEPLENGPAGRAFGGTLRGTLRGSLFLGTLYAVLSATATLAATTPIFRTTPPAIVSGIDGVVIRGWWRARIAVGPPYFAIRADAATRRAIIVRRSGTVLTLEQGALKSQRPRAEVDITLPRLRGVATSGAVSLTLVDRSEAPLFMDLAGGGTAKAEGAVSLLRVTTSGTFDADLKGLTAQVARVHVRQASRLVVRATETLSIVALDRGRVSYAGASRVRIVQKGLARVIRAGR